MSGFEPGSSDLEPDAVTTGKGVLMGNFKEKA
jgi:hypothetical protein